MEPVFESTPRNSSSRNSACSCFSSFCRSSALTLFTWPCLRLYKVPTWTSRQINCSKHTSPTMIWECFQYWSSWKWVAAPTKSHRQVIVKQLKQVAWHVCEATHESFPTLGKLQPVSWTPRNLCSAELSNDLPLDLLWRPPVAWCNALSTAGQNGHHSQQLRFGHLGHAHYHLAPSAQLRPFTSHLRHWATSGWSADPSRRIFVFQGFSDGWSLLLLTTTTNVL